jgi:hypothetical protein
MTLVKFHYTWQFQHEFQHDTCKIFQHDTCKISLYVFQARVSTRVYIARVVAGVINSSNLQQTD